MWRAICAVILLPSLTAAQSEVFSTVQTSEARINLSATAQLKPPSYRPHTYYAEIRRGTSEKRQWNSSYSRDLSLGSRW